MFIDLHAHTYPASDDAFLSADELVDGAKRAGLDGICITEHDRFWDSEHIMALSRRHRFLVLAGSEINTEDGHLLVFGLNKYVFGMHRSAFVKDLVTKHQAAMVAAHPYRRRYPKIGSESSEEMGNAITAASEEQVFKFCHGIETVNGRGSTVQNAFSNMLARRLKVSRTGGSDSHRLDHIGTVCTKFNGTIGCVADLVRELKAGRFEPVGPKAMDDGLPASEAII